LNSSRPAVGTGILVALVIAVLVVAAGVSVAYVLETQPSPTNSASTHSTSTRSTTTGGETSTFDSQVSPAGLQLQIRLNTTEMPQDSNLTAQVYLVNTLSMNLSLTPNFSAGAGIVNWDSYDSLCGLTTVDGIFGFALFQGHYAAGNLSQAGPPMLLTPPVASASCPNRFGDEAYIQNVQFAPESVVATMSANSSFSGVFKAQSTEMQVTATTGICTTSPYAVSGYGSEDGVTTTFSGTELAWGCGTSTGALSGYWTTPVNGAYVGIDSRSNGTITQGLAAVHADYFHQFSPGSYTIVAQDLWNQTVYAHFQVTQASAVTTTSTSQTTTQPLIEIATPSASTSNSSLDLRLVLQLSATGPSGGSLTIGLSAVNLLNSTRTVPYADEWAYPQGALTGSDYCAFPGPLAFGIFSGNFSLSNYKTGNPLPLHDTDVQRSCTITLVPTSFAPLGNDSVGQTIAGYWTGGINTPNPGVFMTFPPGVYTVIGVDEWGQLLLLHFAVSSTTTTTSGSGGTTTAISTTSSSPTNVVPTSTTSTAVFTTPPTTGSGTTATIQLGPTLTGASSSSLSAAYILQIVVAAAVMLSLALMRPRGTKRRGASV